VAVSVIDDPKRNAQSYIVGELPKPEPGDCIFDEFWPEMVKDHRSTDRPISLTERILTAYARWKQRKVN
jgi:hypothetical protein